MEIGEVIVCKDNSRLKEIFPSCYTIYQISNGWIDTTDVSTGKVVSFLAFNPGLRAATEEEFMAAYSAIA